MKITALIIVILAAALSFGGTFTCNGSNNSDGFTRNPHTPVGNQ